MDNDITDAAIADPHWEACDTCQHQGESGCTLSCITMSVNLGDWIICDDYQQRSFLNKTD